MGQTFQVDHAIQLLDVALELRRKAQELEERLAGEIAAHRETRMKLYQHMALVPRE